MATKSLRTLGRIFRRETSSLFQYLQQAWPWVDPADPVDRKGADLVGSIVEQENQWIAELAALIEQRGGVPLPGSFPSDYTDAHYLALEFLLRRLVQYLETNLQALRRDLEELADDPPARNLVASMVEHKEQQLQRLRDLLAVVAPAAQPPELVVVAAQAASP
jgi:hypothetical protein